VSTIVTLTTAVHPTTCSRVQQFSLWHQTAISQILPNVRGLAARMLFPRGVTRTVEGSTNGLQLTTHREREKYPWIAKARGGTESPSTKLLRVRRIRVVSCSSRAVETGELWMICLLRAAHTSIRPPFAFFRILMTPKTPYKTAC
jgi:hypothetical protein